MPTPAITLEALPAGFGDSLLISCPVGRRSWRMLVDTGPDETYPALKARLAQLRPNRQGKRHIDRVEELGFAQAAAVAARVQSDPSRGWWGSRRNASRSGFRAQ